MTKQPPHATWPGGAGGDNPAITGLRVVLAEDDVLLRRRNDPLAALSAREREVLALMAEGRSNAGIARWLWVTEGTVEKHVRSILTTLTLPETADDHRRVLAVLTFLDSR
jgi:DNA-binding NarL/FixJ family response regulator